MTFIVSVVDLCHEKSPQIQEIHADPGTVLAEYIRVINSCYPEEIVRYVGRERGEGGRGRMEGREEGWRGRREEVCGGGEGGKAEEEGGKKRRGVYYIEGV